MEADPKECTRRYMISGNKKERSAREGEEDEDHHEGDNNEEWGR